MLIGLTGYAGSGKDAAAAGLITEGWKRVSFAEPIRQMLLVLNPIIDPSGKRLSHWLKIFDWDETKRIFPEVRRLLQVLGTEVGRDMIDQDLWTRLAKRTWDDHFKAGYNVVVTDVRFANEAASLRFNGGKIFRLHRLGVTPARYHVSDTSVDLIRPDYEIVNNGTVEELQTTLKTMLSTIDPVSVKLNV